MGAPNPSGERLMTAGGAANPNNVRSTFFNTVHLLPKGLRFEPKPTNLLLASGAI